MVMFLYCGWKVNLLDTNWATVNMWWRICPLFTVLIIHHPVWHYTPVLFCGCSFASIMRQGCWLWIVLSWCDKPTTFQETLHDPCSDTPNTLTSCYCHCAIIKQIMFMCLCVCQIFQNRLQVNPHSSSSHNSQSSSLVCVDASVCQWKCLTFVAWVSFILHLGFFFTSNYPLFGSS